LISALNLQKIINLMVNNINNSKLWYLEVNLLYCCVKAAANTGVASEKNTSLTGIKHVKHLQSFILLGITLVDGLENSI